MARIKEIEYISRHDDIVRALRKWRQRTQVADEKLVKDAYVDLGVQSRDALRELYEVKSSCERQALYTAIGQIVVHDGSPSGSCKRFLVLPNDEKVPGDVTRALTRSSISLIRFELQGDKVTSSSLPSGSSWIRILIVTVVSTKLPLTDTLLPP